MHRPRWLKVSLARKVSLLFGTAVLLTIVATLSFPWIHMAALNEQVVLLKARLVAHAAAQDVDLQGGNWLASQRALATRWPQLARSLNLPADPPALVSVDLVREVRELLGTDYERGRADEVLANPDPLIDRMEAKGLDGAYVAELRADPQRLVPLIFAERFRSDAIEELQHHPAQRYYWRTQEGDRVGRLAMAVRGLDTDPHPHALRGIIDVRVTVPRAPATWNLVITILAGASGAVLAILAFYLVTQRLVLSKLTALRSVAERVSTGDIEVRSYIASGDEFEDLSVAFNDMLSHLKSAQDDLRKINRSLDVKLGELSEANKTLYQANQLKSDFLSNVSHELRTPLVSIIGFAELLRDAWEHDSPDKQRLIRFAENILVSGRSLLEIINDLLDLAKIEAGRMELHVYPFSLAELCGDLIDFVRPLADKRQQHLELEVAEDLPEAESDAGKIKQILYNLLSNAIKFSPRKGTVGLQVSLESAAAVRIVVRDTGPGIPEERREMIFEKFRQLDASRTREHEGTGLGLAITRELVDMLEGRIWYEEPADGGAAFVVVLPLRIEAADAPQPVADGGTAGAKRK